MVLYVKFKNGKDEKISCWCFSVSSFKDLTLEFDNKTSRTIPADEIDWFGGWSDKSK